MNQAAAPPDITQSAKRRLRDITDSRFKADPYPFYASLRAQHPVYRARMGKLDAWLITRYDDVAALLKDDRFRKAQRSVQSPEQQARQPWVPAFVRPLETNMLDQDDPNHARLRTLVHKAFTPRRVEQMQARILAISNTLLDQMRAKAAPDLVRDYALPLPLTVIVELLGIPAADAPRFHRWSAALLSPQTPFTMPATIMAVWSFIRYLRKLFAERSAHPQDDLLTALVQAQEEGDHLTADELLAMVFLLLVAGHETTVNLIASGTLALLQFPAQCERLRMQPELIKPGVEELLRFASPVETATERYASEDMVIGGETIRRGELVLAVLASANRDDAQFTRPDELDLARDPNRHLAFGLGGHYCLGAPLARLEGQIAIANLFQRLPQLRLAVPGDKLRWRSTPVVRGLEAMPIKL